MFGSSTWVAHLVLRTVKATKHDGPYVCYGREQPFAGGSHLERTHPTTGSAPAHETCCLDNALASQLRTLSVSTVCSRYGTAAIKASRKRTAVGRSAFSYNVTKANFEVRSSRRTGRAFPLLCAARRCRCGNSRSGRL